MDMSYFQKINNTYQSKSRQETDLYLLNRHVNDCFADTIDYHVVKRNGEPFELLIIKDTDGNTFKKKIKSKHSTPFNLGDYIEWNGQIWLVTLLDPNDKTYHSGYMYLCTVPLRWQNAEGKIVERYAYSEDFTKYSSGVTGNSTITIGDNQYGLTIPTDEETKLLNRDMRFPIDFDDAIQPDVYELTNRKVKLSDNGYFGRGGIITLTLSFHAFNANEDKRVVMDNGQEVWICNYKEPSTPTPPQSSESDKTTDLTATIFGNKELKVGFSRTYTVEFADEKTGSKVDWNDVEFTWNVDAAFDVVQNAYDNKIELSVSDESLVGLSFLLCVQIGEVIVGQIEVDIVEGW